MVYDRKCMYAALEIDLFIFTFFSICLLHNGKVEKILKGSLDSIPLPSPSVKIQIMPGIVNRLLKIKSLLTMPGNVQKFNDISGKVLKPKKDQPPT